MIPPPKPAQPRREAVEVTEHKLIIKEHYLENILNKKKTCEVRFNDRDFQVGDTVYLYSYDELGSNEKIESKSLWIVSYKISHIHSGLGMAENYVILSFKKFYQRY